ncbi:MAG: CRISPR system precrRNA processing endoribonuclease RAMP protein Cas6 [Acidobacteriota bacterium]
MSRDWSWLLDELRVTRLRLELAPRRRFRLPSLPGSMLRGALGHALAELGDAHDVLYRGEALHRGRRVNVPGPYLPEWRGRVGGWKEAGERYHLDLVLLGQARRFAADIAVAAGRAAPRGLGEDRVPHDLITRRLIERPGGTPLRQLLPSLPPEAARRLCLRTLTPVRLAKGHQEAERPTFERLFARSEQRLRGLVRFHVGVEPPAPDVELAERSRAVRVQPDWRFAAVTRQATRHGRLKVGGFLGRLELAGELTPFLPLLQAVTVLHLGAKSTLGHGRVAIAA